MRIDATYDVIVAGGGISGICAAISAARNGVSTALIERYGFLGGMSTAGMVTPFMKSWIEEGEEKIPLVGGIFDEINRTMARQGGMIDNGFSALVFKQVVTKMLLEADVDLFLHSTIAQVHVAGSMLNSIDLFHGISKKTLSGRVFIDTSGDAELLFLSGSPWRKGDEKTGLVQAMTMFFRVGGIDLIRTVEDVRLHPDQYSAWSTKEYDPRRIVSIAGFYDIVKKAKENHEFPDPISYLFFTSIPGIGEAAFNTTNILGLDGTTSRELTQAEIEGRRQSLMVFKILRRDCPGFDKSFLIETGVQIGVRETRRAVGEYVVTGSDVRQGAKFPDPIARGNYGVDIHGQKNESSIMEYLEEGDFYQIPLRALIVKDRENLLTAGRSISSTREGHAALRIQPTSAATGEAAGLLAALAVQRGGKVRSVSYDELQQILIKAGNI